MNGALDKDELCKRIDEYNKQYDCVQKEVHRVKQIRDKFMKKFDRDSISKMAVEDYVNGQSLESFCNMLETDLVRYGEMRGKSNSRKYGVYCVGNNIRHTKKYGKNRDAAFEKIKENINRLLTDAENGSFDEIDNNMIAPLFRSKLLAVYYPEKYLSVLIPDHIDYFLDFLGIDAHGIKSTEKKREMLLDFKESHHIMKNWDNLAFVWFLYELRNEEIKNNNEKLTKGRLR